MGSTSNIDKSGSFGMRSVKFLGLFEYKTEIYGLEVFDNVKFCKPCTIILRGCLTGVGNKGIELYKQIAKKTGCNVKGYREKTYAGENKGLPGPVDGRDPDFDWKAQP